MSALKVVDTLAGGGGIKNKIEQSERYVNMAGRETEVALTTETLPHVILDEILSTLRCA